MNNHDNYVKNVDLVAHHALYRVFLIAGVMAASLAAPSGAMSNEEMIRVSHALRLNALALHISATALSSKVHLYTLAPTYFTRQMAFWKWRYCLAPYEEQKADELHLGSRAMWSVLLIVWSTRGGLYISIQDRLTNTDQTMRLVPLSLHHSSMLPEAVATGFPFNQTSAIDHTHPCVMEDICLPWKVAQSA